ncbi:MAG: peptide chain release factor N(5)-glutamine methyltransferase [Desulfuromonadaceae bacterium]|nr:peptide chain release factor N(5)-glutamine methyltransferase [Desulfuromonadaceae bacterium]
MGVDEIWTTMRILTWTREYLSSKGVENSRLEAEWLLCAVMKLDRVGLYLQFDKPLNEDELSAYRSLITRRAHREPLQHILGSQEFFGLDFEVSADVLIPRHDTEVLVSEALIRHPEAHTILDIGTGSGCVAISLQKHCINAAVTATDISEAALVIARRNALRNDASVEFLQGSLFAPVAHRRFDLIVSNPPYIPTADIELLEQEVRKYDPRTALDGGCDGLDMYRSLIPESSKYLAPRGWLLLEIGIGQSKDIIRLIDQTNDFETTIVATDPCGIERVIGAQRKEKL